MSQELVEAMNDLYGNVSFGGGGGGGGGGGSVGDYWGVGNGQIDRRNLTKCEKNVVGGAILGSAGGKKGAALGAIGGAFVGGCFDK